MIPNPNNYFYCDTCGEIIDLPKSGMLSWLTRIEDGKKGGFRINHNRSSCSYDQNDLYAKGYILKDYYISDFIDLNSGMATLISFIDVGDVISPDRNDGTFNFYETRTFAEIFRRLTLNGYEHSRRKHEAARESGYFEGANEITPYTIHMIEKINENL